MQYRTKRERTLTSVLERDGHLDEPKDKAEGEAIDKATEFNIYRSFISTVR
jgi:hypothetical protein